jgi:predicted nucleic acid-binding protein
MPSASIVFVDTNVLLYGVDERDADERDRARCWTQWCWQRRAGRVSTQVLNEMYANALRKFSMPVALARAEVRRLRAWQPLQIDGDTVDAAWDLQDRFGFDDWDALMLAAADRQGCTHLLTEDLQHDQRIDGLRIVNPFVAGPEILDSIG